MRSTLSRSRRDNPVDCALRELREETGISGLSANDLTLVAPHEARNPLERYGL